MASFVPCKKNDAGGFIFYVGLVSQANPNTLKSSATIAAGDFQVSIDGGALANLGTLPVVTPAASKMVKITLAQAEINGDNITVVCSDAAGAEWCDQIINIQTAARFLDDHAFPATSGRSMVVDAAGLVDANMVKAGATGAGNVITTSGGVTLPAGTVASTTNLTAGTIAAVSGAVGSVTGAVGSVTGAVGSVTANVNAVLTNGAHGGAAATAQFGGAGGITSNLTGNVTGSVGSVTGLTASDVGAIKTKTDFLPSATAGAAGGVFIAGANAATSVTTALTANITGNLSGSVGSVTGAVGSVTGAVGSLTTNNDKTGYSIAVGGVISGANAAAELNTIADAVQDRNMGTGTDSGTDSTAVRTPRQAWRVLRNKVSIAGGTLTCTKEDDTTASFTAAITTAAGNPISVVDPT